MVGNSHHYTIDPIKWEDLCFGNVYYLLSYFDKDLHIPDIVTVEYIGSNIENERRVFIFEKYECDLLDNMATKEKQNIRQRFNATEIDLANIVDLLGLISALERCKKRIDMHQL